MQGISNIVATAQKLAPVVSAIKYLATLGGNFDIFGFSQLEQAQAKAKKFEDTEKLINRIQMGLNDTPAKMNARIDAASTAGAQKILADTAAGISASVEADKKPKEEFDKKFDALEKKAYETIAKLKAETASNPFERLALSAQQTREQIEREFALLPLSIRAELEKLNDIKFSRDVFKEELASTDRINSLIADDERQRAGLGRPGQKRNEFGALVSEDQARAEAERNIARRQIEADRAAISRAGDDPEKLLLANSRLIRDTSDVSRLTEDQFSARGEAIRRNLELEEAVLEKRRAVEDKREAREEKQAVTQEKFISGLVEFGELIKKGIALTLDIKDAPSTRSRLTGVEPSPFTKPSPFGNEY